MTAIASPPNLRDRVLRALIVALGACFLGPALPALAFALMAEIGGRLKGPQTTLAMPWLRVVSAALDFSFAHGGGATAAASGVALALCLLCGVNLRPMLTTAIVGIIAAVVGALAAHDAPHRAFVVLIVAFVLAATATANALYWIASRWRGLTQEQGMRAAS